MNYHWDFSALFEYRSLLLKGIVMTFQILGLSVLMGICVGLVLASLRLSGKRWMRWPGTTVIEVVRSIPPLVLVVWSYYCLPIITGITLTSYWTCVIALSLYTGVFFAEIFRAGLQAVDKGQVEAGKSLGFSRLKILFLISGPQALLRIIPPFTNQCVMSVKNSVLGSYIAVGEVLYEAQRLSIQTFRPLEVLTAVALFFVITILPLTLLAGRLEAKILRRYFSR